MAYSKSSVSVNHHYFEERARSLGVQRIKDIIVQRVSTYKSHSAVKVQGMLGELK